MENLYLRMTESCSLLRIQYQAEAALAALGRDGPAEAGAVHRGTLERIREADTLDEAHAMAYEAMGRAQQAVAIRSARTARLARTHRASALAQLLELD